MKKLSVTVLVFGALIAACDTDENFTGPGFSCDVSNPVQDIFLTPQHPTMFVRSPAVAGDTLQLIATVTNRFGTARTDVPINFTSSDTMIATVDTLGVVHARKTGTVRITASACGEEASTTVTVAPVVISLQIEPDTTGIVVGDSLLLTARAITQTGDTLRDVKFTFSVSPSGAGVIHQKSDSTATLVTTSSGNVTVTATGEGKTVSTVLNVQPRVFLAGSEAIAALSSGQDFACGLISLGRGYCWGANDVAQLGTATDSICFSESPPGLLTSKPCTLYPLRIAPKVAFTALAAGDQSACALDQAQHIFCWGAGESGQLGIGGGSASTPTRLSSPIAATAITVGGKHACAIASTGLAYCWGLDSAGQLGDARNVNSTTPIPVFSPSGAPTFSQISAGFRHTCAINGSGIAFCWGLNDSLQLGDNTNATRDMPAQVATGLTFRLISAGRFHTCGLSTAGAAYCWGWNRDGQLGNAAGIASAVPVAVDGGLTFARISSGAFHTCALTAAGAVYCWGSNADLQLGRGPVTGAGGPSSTPVQVTEGELPAGVTFVSVAAGAHSTCAVGSDGNAYCWGSNVFGALGNTLQAAFRGLPQKVATPQP